MGDPKKRRNSKERLNFNRPSEDVMLRMLLVVACAASLAACAEADQHASYDGRTYSGKADTQPWAGAPFEGDKTAWDRALTERASKQNEYSRVR